MKRDMDLIRLLLEQFETGQPPAKLAEYDEDAQLYHCALIIEAGFAHGSVVPGPDGVPMGASVSRLTWEGHEFLDAVRDESTWNKAKDLVKSSAGSATAEILKDTCKSLISAGIEAAMRVAANP